MSLIPCPKCAHQISPQAQACPQCGHPVRKYWGFQWRTQAEICGWPLVHVAVGRNRETGKLLVAKGIVAVGQFGMGIFTIAQFGIGVVFGFGQFILGFTAVAQIAVALYFGAGQVATGQTAIGQIAFGQYVLAQIGFGQHVWSTDYVDPEAKFYFEQLWKTVKGYLPDMKQFAS